MSTTMMKMISAAIVATGTFTLQASAARPCPPDINCSGTVNVDDLLLVINNWGQSGVPSDVDGSGLVEVNDLLGVINAWGACVFNFGPNYPDTEAHQIGLEMLGANGPLVLSQEAYDRVDRDLDLIRAAYPALVGQTHSLAWAPNQILVKLIAGQNLDEYNCHNVYYRLTNSQSIGGGWYTLTFAGKFNVPRLASIYQAMVAVQYGEPNGFIGGQNYWEPSDLGNGVWRWNIDDGWHDCFDGCDCHKYYVIDVDAKGNVTLVSYQEIGQSWCEF